MPPVFKHLQSSAGSGVGQRPAVAYVRLVPLKIAVLASREVRIFMFAVESFWSVPWP